MNKASLIGLVATAWMVMFVGVGGVAANLAATSARYPHASRVISENISLGSLRQPSLNEDAEYVTDHGLMTVAAWYARRYHFEPPSGLPPEGQCIRQAKLTEYFGLRQLVVVSLCPYGGGTKVSFYRTVTLERVWAPRSAGHKE